MFDDNDLSQKKIFLVLGIARSGTSVIAKALNVLGIDLGINLNPSNKWNPKGFWEDIDIVYTVNKKIFDKLNCRLGVFREFQQAELNSDSLNDIKLSATQILTLHLRKGPNWGFKDPNTVR